MFYLLYEESIADWDAEHFVLFESDANQKLVESFIAYYFGGYQILASFSSYTSVDSQIAKLIKIDTNEILHIFQRKEEKEQYEKEYSNKLHQVLVHFNAKEIALKKKLKDIEEKMNTTIFRNVEFDEITEELKRKMKQEGYDLKRKSGKIRFRHQNHQKIRMEFESNMKKVKEEIEENLNEKSKARDLYMKEHPMKTFEDVKRYHRC